MHPVERAAGMPLYCSTSRARRNFKKLLGNANHKIITALVGLDAIERGIVTRVPEELHTAWSPRNPIDSARRSRILILEMTLVRCVDALDMYIRESIRKPTLIQSPELQSSLDKCGRSVFEKFRAVDNHFGSLDEVLSSLIALMIVWRNRRVHSDTNINLENDDERTIRENNSSIGARFRGLDANLLLNRYKQNKGPQI